MQLLYPCEGQDHLYNVGRESSYRIHVGRKKTQTSVSWLWEHEKPFLSLSSPPGLYPSPFSPSVTPFQLSSVPSVHAPEMLWGWSFLILSITTMPGRDSVGLSPVLSFWYGPAQQSWVLSDPGYFYQTWSCSRLVNRLPSFTLDLPYYHEPAWRCHFVAETGCSLQACPAPLAGLLAGEIPVPRAVILHLCHSSLGSRPCYSPTFSSFP